MTRTGAGGRAKEVMPYRSQGLGWATAKAAPGHRVGQGWLCGSTERLAGEKGWPIQYTMGFS